MSPLHAAVPLANGGVLPLADLPLLGKGHFIGALLAELPGESIAQLIQGVNNALNGCSG